MYFEIRETEIDRHIQSEDARALLSLWQGTRVDAELPLTAAFWATELPSRPYLLLASAQGDGDWHYDQIGAGLETEHGGHRRSLSISELSERHREFVHRCFRLVEQGRAPVYAVHSAPNAQNVLLWERLMLPCRSESGEIAIVTYLRPLEYLEDMVRAVLDSTPSAILRVRCIRDEEGRI